MNNKLDIRNINVEAGSASILKNVSLSIENGEFMSLLGPSGCGKTTLLKAIAGIVHVSSGSILMDGNDVSSVSPHRRNAVIVFQDLRLFPHMTVAENIAFPLRMKGMKKNERLEKASEYLSMVKLSGIEKRRVAEISGGQQQRVSLARALAADPELLLLDEPFSSLDENLREEMRELILSVHSSMSMTTVMVTHDRAEALSMSDRISIMFSGRIHQTDTPENICAFPADDDVRTYLGRFAGKEAYPKYFSRRTPL